MMIKLNFVIGIIALLSWSCSSVKETSKSSARLVANSPDSTEYELIIIDIGFDNWYLLNYSPAKDYTNEYYRSRNLVGVINWNGYYREAKYTRVIDSYIDYQPNIDYGIEVNRKLYWYFKYIAETYKINLFNSPNVATPP